MKMLKVFRIYFIIVLVGSVLLPIFTEATYNLMLPAYFLLLVLIFVFGKLIRYLEKKEVTDEVIQNYAVEHVKPKVRVFINFIIIIMIINFIGIAIKEQDITPLLVFSPIILITYLVARYFSR
ncbi:hypothetical protein [Vallitalea okinawensis]|uniref:hypothetical protein n=1 Tax=Vallitalea okinawensis TaxID=2078660 RepID=UPI000CFB529B|nr:hypothetical protein [Vallitalea okinawensis]